MKVFTASIFLTSVTASTAKAKGAATETDTARATAKDTARVTETDTARTTAKAKGAAAGKTKLLKLNIRAAAVAEDSGKSESGDDVPDSPPRSNKQHSPIHNPGFGVVPDFRLEDCRIQQKSQSQA